jgi:hypothetical protein
MLNMLDRPPLTNHACLSFYHHVRPPAPTINVNIDVDGVEISLSHVDLARGMGQLRDYWRRSPFIRTRFIRKRTIGICRVLCVSIYTIYIVYIFEALGFQ